MRAAPRSLTTIFHINPWELVSSNQNEWLNKTSAEFIHLRLLMKYSLTPSIPINNYKLPQKENKVIVYEFIQPKPTDNTAEMREKEKSGSFLGLQLGDPLLRDQIFYELNSDSYACALTLGTNRKKSHLSLLSKSPRFSTSARCKFSLRRNCCIANIWASVPQ